MVLKKASVDGTKTPLFLEALGNELYQAGQLLTCQVVRRRAKRQHQDQYLKSKSQLNPLNYTVNSKG